MAFSFKEKRNWQTCILIGVAAIIAYLTLVPLMMMLYGTFRDAPPGFKSSFSLQNYLDAFGDRYFFTLLLNSLIFAVFGGSLASIIGLFLAWVSERTNTPLRWLIYAAAIADLMTPGVLKSISWVLLLSPRIGVVNLSIMRLFGLNESPINPYSMGGMVWAHGVDSFALPFFLMAAALRSMDPALEEAALTSGTGKLQTFYHVTLKLMLPAMLATWLLAFIRAFETFEVPAVLGLPAGVTVLASQVYISTRISPTNVNLASTYSTVYLAIAISGLLLYYRTLRFSEKYAVITGKAFRPARMDLGKWRYFMVAVVFLVIFLISGMSLGVVLYSSFLPFYTPPSLETFRIMSLRNYYWLIEQDIVWRAFRNTLGVGIGSATVTVFLASVVAWISIRTHVPGRKLLDALAFSPIAIPGIVLGLSLMWLYLVIPIPIYGTIWILLIAYVSHYMPVCVRACSISLTQIHQELEEASLVSGASWWFTFSRVLVPLMLPGVFAGWVYVLTLTFKVVSLPVLLSGSGTEVVPVLIFDLYQDGAYTRLAALGVVVVLLIVVISGSARFATRRYGLEAAG